MPEAMTLTQYVFPLRSRSSAFFRSQRVIFREVFDPAKWPAGVNDGARVGEIALGSFFRRNSWIDGAAPASTHNFDRCFRIAPCGYRTETISRVGLVDDADHCGE